MKILLAVVVILAACAGGGYWYWKNRVDDVPEYKTVAVTKGDLIQTVTATGQVNPVTNVTVGSQVSGIISKLYADFNSKVTNGQLLAQIDPQTYEAVVAQNRGDLASSEAQHALDEVNLMRAAVLLTNKIMAQSDYDQAKATSDQSAASVLIKKATLDQGLVNLAYTKIYAPIDGLVLSRDVDVGQTVAASFAAPTLFVIANDISKMEIDALVSEADIGAIQTNQTVNFTVDAFPSRNFRGTVIQVRNFPETNQNVVCYDTMISVDNHDLLLKPGMTANVSIVTDERDGALRIPNTALRYRPPDVSDPAMASPGPASGPGPGSGMTQTNSGARGGARGHGKPAHTIYVLADDPNGKGKVAKAVTVHTGVGDGIYTEITDGLNEGDEVIVGQITGGGASGSKPPSNPFGGGRRF